MCVCCVVGGECVLDSLSGWGRHSQHCWFAVAMEVYYM